MRTAAFFSVLALATVFGGEAANARCAYGEQELPGSIGPHQTDDSRSFTIEGSATIGVYYANDEVGTPTRIWVSFPGYCGGGSAPTVTCRVSAHEVVNAVIYNPTDHQVTYRWVCSN